MAKKDTTEPVPAVAPAPDATKPETAPNLVGALLRAQMAIDGVGKDSRNDFHKYRYTSAEGMISACRAALAVGGLTVRRRHWEVSADGLWLLSKFEVAYSITGESQVDTVSWAIVSEAKKPADKSLASALTTSLSYWLRDLLLLPREDEDSMDRRNDDAARTQRGLTRENFQPTKFANVSALNERVAATAAKPATAVPTVAASPLAAASAPKPAESVPATGRVVRAYTRSANGKEFPMASVEFAGGAAPLEFIVDPAVASISDLVGKQTALTIVDRGEGKAGLITSASELDTETGEILF